MDKASPFGFILGTACIIIAIMLDGKVEVFVNAASIMIVFGGVSAAVVISYPFEKVIENLKAFPLIFQESKIHLEVLIDQINDLAHAARKEGLLVLEERSKALENKFMQKAIMLMVDGTDPRLIRDILETELERMAARHREKQGFWEFIAESGPAWGMIGTLIGLVNMLAALSDPSTLGPKMSVALITTFYGCLIANFIAIPTLIKLRGKTDIEIVARQMIIEGILSIQAGDNPRVIEEKLKSYLPPSKRRIELDDLF